MVKRLGLVALLGAALGVSACASHGYGYGGVSAGYGGYYGDPYFDGYGPGYASYGGLGYGWYNGFYYPGTGYYVYDRHRRPFRWNDGQRRYWQGRPGYGNPQVRDNWRDFGRDVRIERRDYRGDLRTNRQAFRSGAITSDQFRQGRFDARREYRSDVRQDVGELRRQNRAQGIATPRPDGAFRANPGTGRGFGGSHGFGGGRGFGGHGGAGRRH